MKRLLLLSTIFSLLTFATQAQYLPCYEVGVIDLGQVCSGTDTVYGCDNNCTAYGNPCEAVYHNGVTHFSHDISASCGAIPPCHADFAYSVAAGVYNLIDSSLGLTGNPMEYLYDFGDGFTSTDPNPAHPYSTSGYKIVCLTISDTINGGFSVCTSTSCRVILVQNGGGCNAAYSVTTNCGITTFTDLSTGSGYSGNVDFGDNSQGTFTPTEVFIHQYAVSGTYQILYNIADSTGACSSGTIDSITVVVPTVTAGFSYTTTGSPTNVVTFTNLSTGATSYYWDLGNGDTSNAINPVVDYDTSTCERIVQLFAFDINGCGAPEQQQLVNVCVTGINSIPSVLNSMSIFPNPAKEDVTVVLNSRKASDVTLTMRDVTGREVMDAKTIHLHGGENNYKLTLPTLPSGVYIIQINDEIGMMNKSVLIR